MSDLSLRKKELNVKESSFIKTLKGETNLLPFWFMRQAGRYLPEYRKIRKNINSFLDLCFNPNLAAEVTIQPLARYDMSAAILFSDILVIPHALGQSVSFKGGVGPVLGSLNNNELNLNNLNEILSPVYETVSLVKKQLNSDKSLIGFAGSPWTVATYMIEGSSSREFLKIRQMMYKKPEELQKIIDLLVDATSLYLLEQIKSGVDAIQLFDSWASVLPEEMFNLWVIKPTAKIVSNIKAEYPDVPIIGFPKGAGILYPEYIKKTGVDAVSLDHTIPLNWAAEHVHSLCPVQGCLDPMALLVGGDIMISETQKILDAFSDRPFIFNLGHGIHKETPVEHVEHLVSFLKDQ